MAAGTNRTVTLKNGSILGAEDAKKYGKSTIALDKLNTGATPAVVPTVPPTTAPQALEGAIKGGVDAFQSQLNVNAAQSKTQEQSSFEQLLSETLNAPTTEGLTSTEYAKKGGVDELTPQLTELNKQIIAEQEALRTQTKELMKNTAGLESRALNEEASRLRTESLDRQAALSVTQLSLQGRYDSAKEVADRAVAAKFAEGQRKLDILELSYNRNKSLFDKDEQRAFETAQADRQTKIEMEAYKEKAKYDQILRQSDPLYRVQLAKAQKEYSLLGEPSAEETAKIKEAQKNATSSAAAAGDKLAAIDILSTHPGLNSRVGATPFTRGPQGLGGVIGRTASIVGIPGLIVSDLPDTATGAGQSFSGGVHKLISGLSLQELIEAKSRGATFGALSDSELRVLANSASSIADWEIKDKNGKGTGFWDVDQASFEKELGTIKSLTQRALVSSGGSLISEDEDAELDSVFNTSASPASFY